MSFQVSSADGTEIKESVATAEEEFKNSTAEETERKLEDQEEFKNSRTEKLKRKLAPEDEEDFKNSTVEESEGKLVPEDEEEFKDIRTKKLKRKVIPEDEEDFKSSTVEETEIKVIPEDEEDEEVEYSGKYKLPPNLPLGALSELFGTWTEDQCLGDIGLFDEEDEELPRTQSMDNLAIMHKPQHQ